VTIGVALLACASWLYLLLMRGGFWRIAEHVDDVCPSTKTRDAWPRVVAIVPARNEAELIATSIESLLRQDYSGAFHVVVVDDHSTDATAAIASQTAVASGVPERLNVLSSPPLADQWTGKLWAMNCGVMHADALPEPPDYLLFSDADISYAPNALTELVARARMNGLVLTSLMARLHCESFAEQALIPAFVFFFRMLYPFAWVNQPQRRTAAAAGGCMLVQRNALHEAGGLAAIRHELIDDCALGRVLKRRGRIWLGLTQRARSLRACRDVGDVRRMVRRSAYAQLRYSPWLLIGTVVAMAVTYLAPPLLAAGGGTAVRLLAGATWLLMAAMLQPTLRFYGVSRWFGLAFPAIAATYLVFTLDSAYQHWRGRGGAWKGRVHIPAADGQ
jgi:hopene-associated glycosyltransferase HpnB